LISFETQGVYRKLHGNSRKHIVVELFVIPTKILSRPLYFSFNLPRLWWDWSRNNFHYLENINGMDWYHVRSILEYVCLICTDMYGCTLQRQVLLFF